MARKRLPFEGKLRTREHVLADLGVNHIERQVLLCGWSIESIRRDYGIDLILFTYAASGEKEPGLIFIQVKSVERLARLQTGTHAAFRIDRSDLVGWLAETIPIFLVAYEAESDRAYWI